MFGIGECVFDGGADCIHVIKDLSWELEPRKMKKMSPIKRFQKSRKYIAKKIILG